MNFAGWVPLRRGILAHVQEGKLSNDEALVLIILILLADKSTGAGTINGPCLRTFVPGLSHDAAKRVLPKLQQKGYIFREIKHRSKAAYRYWVNRYEVTDGPNKKRQVDLSQVLKTKNVADIRYVVPAPDDAPETAPEGAPNPAPHYNNREVRSDNKQNPIDIVNEVCASTNNTQAVETPVLEQSENSGTGQCASPCDATALTTRRSPFSSKGLSQPSLAIRDLISARRARFSLDDWTMGGFVIPGIGRPLTEGEVSDLNLRRTTLDQVTSAWKAYPATVQAIGGHLTEKEIDAVNAGRVTLEDLVLAIQTLTVK